MALEYLIRSPYTPYSIYLRGTITKGQDVGVCCIGFQALEEQQKAAEEAAEAKQKAGLLEVYSPRNG